MKVLAPVRWLGLVSYSFYLIHLPIFALHDAIFARFKVADDYLKHFSGIAAALVTTVIFFWIFERPFLSSNQKEEMSAAPLGPPQLTVGANV
jgi:peptidoglycan/LPS O-acetylase OafA/YrhL